MDHGLLDAGSPNGSPEFRTPVVQPIVAIVKVDIVEENGDFRRCRKWPIELYTCSWRVVRIADKVTHMFASQEVQIGGSKDEYVIDPAVECGIVPCDDVTVNPFFGKVLVRSFHSNGGTLVDIQFTKSVRETRSCNKRVGEVYCFLSIDLWLVWGVNNTAVELAEDRHVCTAGDLSD